MREVTVNCKEDCDNAPKKRIVRDYNIAAARGDTSFIAKHLHDDAVWQRYHPGNQSRLEGKEALLQEYEQDGAIEPRELTIDHIISHGKICSANGVVKARDGNTYVFNNVYLFSSHGKNAPIKEITSFVIKLDN